MSRRCETCPLNTEEVSEVLVLRGWRCLAEGLQSAAVVQGCRLGGLAVGEAQANAIKDCYEQRVLTGECETSVLHAYQTADFDI